MTIFNKKLSTITLVTLLSGSYAIAGGGEDTPLENPTQTSTKMVEKPAETETHDQGTKVSVLENTANEDDISIEELQQKLAKMKQQNDETELKRQKEIERQNLLRQIKEEEERKKRLQTPAQKPTEKNLSGNLGDFGAKGFRSLAGLDKGSYVDKDGQYHPSEFVETREKLKDSGKQLLKKWGL